MTALEVIALRIDSLLVSILAGTKMARVALTDLLKFAYNLLAHYPKVKYIGFLDARIPDICCRSSIVS